MEKKQSNRGKKPLQEMVLKKKQTNWIATQINKQTNKQTTSTQAQR